MADDSCESLQENPPTIPESAPAPGALTLIEELHSVQKPFPLTHLPPELISYIFENIVVTTELPEDSDSELLFYTASTDIVDSWIKSYQAVLLAGISSYFREVAHDTPSLWIYMHESLSPEDLDACLLRSGGCPLHVRILRGDGNLNEETDSDAVDPSKLDLNLEIIARLCQHSARWSTLFISASLVTMLTPQIGCLSMLRSLIVHNDSRRANYDNINVPWRRELAAWKMPNIITYSGVYAISPNIGTSSLKKVHHLFAPHKDPERRTLCLTTLLSLLSSADVLEEISLAVICIDPQQHRSAHHADDVHPFGPVILPRLRALRLWVEGVQNPYNAIVEQLHLPGLHTVNLKLHPARIPSALQYLAHAKHIQNLELGNTEPAEADTNDTNNGSTAVPSLSLTILFDCMPALRALRVERLELTIRIGQASNATLNLNSIPPTLRSVLFASITIGIGELQAFLSILRQSKPWPAFEQHSIVLQDCFTEAARTAELDLELATCGDKVKITPLGTRDTK